MSIPDAAIQAAADVLARSYDGPLDLPSTAFTAEARAVLAAVAPLLTADLACVLRAEARAGEHGATARQPITYQGGLERAARIVAAAYPKET